MIKEKISSQEIIDLVASKASVSKRAAEEFLKVMIASIEEALLAGEVVKIKNFGTFKLQWNEPRKSVNVQTGAEIMLAGYYKVGFTPDASLREQVNEPFAHLEPVELDVEINDDEKIEESEQGLDPLRLFTEQASEIKDLISEIQALSVNPKSVISERLNNHEDINSIEKIKEATIPDDEESTNKNKEADLKLNEEENSIEQERIQDVSTKSSEIQSAILKPTILEEKVEQKGASREENVEEHIQAKSIAKNINKGVDFKSVEEENSITYESKQNNLTESTENTEENKSITSKTDESQLLSDLLATPYLDNIKPIKRHKVWIWVLILLFSIMGLGTGLYFLYPPFNEFSTKSIVEISEKLSIQGIINSVSKWFSPAVKPTSAPVTVIVPKDTNNFDSISQNRPVDSLQILFDNPRVYSNFIASERIKDGNRLTIMSKRYYGSKDFWVYIYEANKDRISNPDKIPVGTLIRIPKLDPRLIDAANPRCMKKAKELHDIYIK